MMVQTRKCKGCGQQKPETSFGLLKGKYRRHTCHKCRDKKASLNSEPPELFEIVEEFVEGFDSFGAFYKGLKPRLTPDSADATPPIPERERFHARPTPPINIDPSGIKRVLFIPDTHVPYHDTEKFELMLRAARVFRPEIIVILGDFADFYAVSSHDKAPDRSRSLKDEVREVNAALTQIQELGAERVIYVSGNHEDRYDRYISTRAPEFFGMASLKEIFKIEERGWEWVPYKRHMTLGKLHITHDCGKAGAHAHTQAQATFEGNVIIGHTHRMAFSVVGNAEGKPHVCAMFGWLGDTEAVDYLNSIQVKRSWAHGFGIGYLLPDDSVHVIPVTIVKNQVIIEGKLIS